MKPRQTCTMYWLLMAVLLVAACRNNEKLVAIDPGFSKYINAYTSGVVSKKTSIKVQLAAEASTVHTINETIDEKLFDISPSVKGKAYWTDARTIEFKPAEDLQPGRLYTISFALHKVMNVPGKFNTFTFNLQVVKPSFAVKEFGLVSENNSNEKMTLRGQVLTADVENKAVVEKLLSALVDGQTTAIAWQHNEVNKTYNFTINGIMRGNTAGQLTLQWDGEPLGAPQKDSKQLEVPARGDFKVLAVRPVQASEEYALVQFSDPIAINQNLGGLITMSDQQDVGYAIEGSEVKVYAASTLTGNFTLNVYPGIENLWGKKLAKSFTANVFFENRLPSVKIHGRGHILPGNGNKLVLPFEAVNLRAVDVSIIKIHENNVVQFLQTNDYNGDGELRRVAKPLVQATIALDGDKSLDLHRRNRFSIDIDKYLRTEPGAIYRLVIGFRPEYSLYECAAGDAGDAEDETSALYDDEVQEEAGSLDEDDAFWQRYDDYYPYGYNWQQRDNPCSKSYYSKERFAGRNIIASNIGLTAKRGTLNEVMVIATNIISTEPLSGVQLQLLDYQNQVIATGTTGSDGSATIPTPRKPFLLVAKQQQQRGYLKMDDGNALPLSRFDVAGDEMKQGLKAYIFGERGVWRPGDSLYISCIVFDKAGTLPQGHPVEFELYSPQGQLYKKIIQTNAVNGFNVFRTATDTEAPTGNWLCKVRVGGAVFDKRLRIETIAPNRLKIDVNLNGATALGGQLAAPVTLSARWLFGATAQNLKARIDASLYKYNNAFPRYAGYSFTNPTAGFAAQEKTLFDGALGPEGSTSFKPSFGEVENAPGVLQASLLVKVFEPGGNFSIDQQTIPYHPYNSYVGVKMPEGAKPWGYLATGKTHRAEIVNVDTKGNLSSANKSVVAELYKIQWRWWWDNTGDDLSNFTQDTYNKLIKKERVPIAGGRATYTVNLGEGEWGRYLLLVRDETSGHITGQVFYVDDPYWQNRDNADDPTAAAMLSFTSSKPSYNVGEDIALTIPSSKGGRALISIETGSRVLKTIWTETQQGQTVVTFKAGAEMAPNIYANVSLLQPYAQTLNDLPIRMYGVLPVQVEDKGTQLKPAIKAPAVIRPQQPATITVAEANGNDMTYVVALVDDGLLDLTRFATPNPHKAFFAKEALGVKTWDLFDYVIGAWGSDLERILTIGGDADGALIKPSNKANRFKPVVRFMGPFTSNGRSQTHSFTLPAYMGSVRAMVIAAGNGKFGFAEQTIAVKKPLMLLASLPRVLGPAEEIKIPVTVFATDSRIKNATLQLQANNYLQPVGAATQQVSFNGTGEQLVYFNAKVKNTTGVGTIKLVATSGSESATYDVELDIRNPNPPVTTITEKTISGSQGFAANIQPIGTGGTNQAVLEISSIPAIDLQKRLQYLVQYPHGCVEQITSAAFPQVVLQQLLALDPQRALQTDANVRRAIDHLKNFQLPNGGFAYWPNSGPANDWGTSYAGHFLLEAQNRGFNVPATMLQSWRGYQRTKANSWNLTEPVYYGGDLAQAYRLYLLALANAPEQGAMNRLKEYRFLSAEGKWRLAAAYFIVGQKATALQLISGLPTNFNERPAPGITFGSSLRDQAMVLETLTIMGRRAEADRLVRSIAAQLTKETWYSTQTTAFALVAIARYAGGAAGDKKMTAVATINGKEVLVSGSNVLWQTTLPVANGACRVQVSNKGSNALFVRVINRGQPVAGDSLPAGSNSGLLYLSGTFLTPGGAEVNPQQLQQGTDFIAKVTVKNTGQQGTFNQMALSQIFPGGWEILNTRLLNNEGAFASSPVDYLDIRDDRVYHYFSIKQNETLTFYVRLNAAYAGRYYWPGVYCEGMYNNQLQAASNGGWVMVKQ